MDVVEEESKIMRMFRGLRLESVAWSLRRLHCLIDRDALVLEVGAGGNPYPRSNVLLDAYEDSQERHWEPLRRDRPFVFGFIENLPFKDRSFDFLIASHVLEHSTSPEKSLVEFQRVAKAGYIEVPDALFERLFPYRDHRLEITVRDRRLMIRKKAAWLVDSEFYDLCHRGKNDAIDGHLVSRNPFAFHVRYYWRDQIDFMVVNPEVDNTWIAPASDKPTASPNWRQSARQSYLDLMNRWFAQNARNAQIDIYPLLQCPRCSSGCIMPGTAEASCTECRASYPLVNGAPVMYAGGK
jgi:hypothetical protein